MGDTTGIAWTDHTWNPWQGCTKVSEACKNCYMFRDKKRYGQDPEVVTRSARQTFNLPLAKFGTRSTKGKPGEFKWPDGGRVFVCSWSDFFHADADAWREEAWEVMRQRPGLTFQLLTKRPERIEQCLPDDWGDQYSNNEGYPNVWLGVTVENQLRASERLGALVRIPAAARFVSAEPLLGSLDLNRVSTRLTKQTTLTLDLLHRGIDWVIVGGESGPGARAMNPAWASHLLNQCQEAGVAFFLKQMHQEGREMLPIPQDLMVREFPNGR